LIGENAVASGDTFERFRDRSVQDFFRIRVLISLRSDRTLEMVVLTALMLVVEIAFVALAA